MSDHDSTDQLPRTRTTRRIIVIGAAIAMIVVIVLGWGTSRGWFAGQSAAGAPGGAPGGAGEAVQLLHKLLALGHHLLIVGLVFGVFGFVRGGFVALHPVVDEQGKLVERLG